MNNEATRQKAMKILVTALDKIDDLDIPFNFIGLLSFFDEEGNCTGESRSWFEGTKMDIVAAECLLEEIKNENKNNLTAQDINVN
jgi:hypothetical protein